MSKYIALLLGFFGSTQAMHINMVQMLDIADEKAVEYVLQSSGQSSFTEKNVLTTYIRNMRSTNTPEYQKFITAVYIVRKLDALNNPEEGDAASSALQTIQKTLVNFSTQQQQLVQYQITYSNKLEQRSDVLEGRNATSVAVATCVSTATLLAIFVLFSYVGTYCI